MTENQLERLKSLIMFVMAWLVAVYIYEVAKEAFHGTVGLLMAALTVGVNWYARKRAAASAGDNWTFKFWLYLPMTLFLVVPVAVKLIQYYRSGPDRSWWTHAGSLLPVLLTLGVPLAVLLWVYLSLGRIDPIATEDPPDRT